MSSQQPLLFALEPHPLQQPLCAKIPAEPGLLEFRHFPDGESFLKLNSTVTGRDCVVLADLSHPDAKFLPMVFLAETLEELGANSAGLVAPYLSYMRQDRRFSEGEALTSRIFAAEVAAHFDWLVTVDPHLHRYQSLSEIYSIPSTVVHADSILASWLSGRSDTFLVGPDAESEQWVSAIAEPGGLPYVIGEKTRLGDRQVNISLPDLKNFAGKTAIIIDDVIASGHTILECMRALQKAGIADIECACIHGIFADDIDKVLINQGLGRLVSANTIKHESNTLDVSDLVATSIREFLDA